VRSKTSVSNKKYLLPKDLARVLRRSERTVREYCKAGKILEAVRTGGGHWRIRRPLSGQTRLFLEKLRGEWPFDGSSEVEGEFESDMARWLMEARLYEKNLDECFPVPELADLPAGKRAVAAQIQSLIWQRMKNRESVSDLLLLGWVYQFWLNSERCPMVAEIAKLMGISRSDFYRKGHTFAEIRNAYHWVCESIRIDLPGRDVADFAGSES
jgi:hypothetical protein